MKVRKRQSLPRVNRFQKRVMFAVMLGSLLGFIFCLLVLDYFYFDESSILFDFSWAHFRLLVKWFAPLAVFALLVMAMVSLVVTHRILGPYERIIRELDEIIDGKHRRLLSVRQKDEMFSDLLRRINALIKRIPD